MRRSTKPGFTLIESSLAIVIVGVGCVAAMELFASVTHANKQARRHTVAAQLARHLEEAMAHLPYDDPITRDATFGPEPGEVLANYNDLDDFNGLDTTGTAGPIDALRMPISELDQYAQLVTVTPVDDDTLAEPGTGALRVDVIILWQRAPGEVQSRVAHTTWFRTP